MILKKPLLRQSFLFPMGDGVMIAYIYITHTCTYIKKVLISYIFSLNFVENARKGLNPVDTNLYCVESPRKGLSLIHKTCVYVL